MLLNEIAEVVGMTKRAVKYYEEMGLLDVKKDCNGYRNYTENDIEALRRISVYRKLGIGVKDIKRILSNDDNNDILRSIYQQKLNDKHLLDEELQAFRDFLNNGDTTKADACIDYQNVESAIESLLPGEWGNYFKNHFKPFLNIRISTQEQKQALNNLLSYCDNTTIKVPFLLKLGIKVSQGISFQNKSAEDMIAYYRDMNESEYIALREQVKRGVKIKSGIMKYHPVFLAQRKLQKELQNKGYNDVFIPNLMALSPLYADYKEALDSVNARICRELGLYYDANYNLVMKK